MWSLKRGTPLMPTHSPNYTDPAKWSNPPVPQEWWPMLYEQMPAFDPRLTPSWWMGQVAETFRTWPSIVPPIPSLWPRAARSWNMTGVCGKRTRI
jgi:aminoglycoside 3-N-acetyltransferase